MEISVAKAAEEIVSLAFENTEYELVEVEFKHEKSGWNIIIYADKADGLSLDDCEAITHMIDPLLDEDERVSGKHDHLIVSSPGLDRPLKSDADFKRNTGRRLDVKLFTPVQGKRSFTGVLSDFDEESLTLSTERAGDVRIKRADISSARQHIDFE